jgi:hypothetical protein
MKKLILLASVVAAVYFGVTRTPDAGRLAGEPAPAVAQVQAPAQVQAHVPDALLAAIRDKKSGTQVTGEGTVTKVLADDNDGSRHQRFILTLPTGQTLLVAHNIDLAPRIRSLKEGDPVVFHGVYEWNAKGGVIHWTHHDPAGRHEPGWLRHGGQAYQ